MKTTRLALLALILLSSVAKADGIQVCVDSEGSTYKAEITGFAKEGSAWSGRLQGQGRTTLVDGTQLETLRFKGNLADSTDAAITDLAYALKHEVTPNDDSVQDGTDISYNDEPRVYESNGVNLVCSSTMSPEEYAAVAK